MWHLKGEWRIAPGGSSMEFLLIPLAAAVGYVLSGLRVLNQYERGVMFLLGRYTGTRGPGLLFAPPGFVRMKRVSMRIVALDVPPQDVITRDNISVKVNAVLYFRVADPALAIMEIQDYLSATGQLAQTTLLSVLGQVELDELLADRRKVNNLLREIIDERTDFWGVEISAVEIKDVLLPDGMRRAIARQAEAERERRAKVINAQGELQASETLAQAARMLSSQPASLQLRYLQTVTEIAAENNSTTIFPIPMELIRPFIGRAADVVASTADGVPAPAEVAGILPTAPGSPGLVPPAIADALPTIRREPIAARTAD
jgi:regulator of protease activity HflC (stomatin/prohibitin superfamily)